DQRVLRHRDLDAVDRARHHVGHDSCPAKEAKSVDAEGSKGQPPCSQCATYSSLKYCTDEVIGLVAPSPSAQKERPRMLSQASSNVSMSCASPSPFSKRSRIFTIQ